MAAITLDNVKLVRGSSVVLEIDHLDIGDGEMLVVLGPSGAGKSMLLRVIAGLEVADSGKVYFDGIDKTDVDTARRGIAMVFQDQALYPFFDVRGNVAFPLRLRRLPVEEVDARVEAEARILEIEHLLDRLPKELGAGHQQLVQTARALVRVPEVFLMDEPLARLDAHLRGQMRSEFRTLQRGYGVTTVFVTNEPEEAMVMADRVVVLDRGVIRQIGSPLELYHEPESRFVAAMLGPMGFVRGRVVVDRPGYWLEFGRFRIRVWAPVLGDLASTWVVIGLRPEDVVADPSGVEVTIGSGYFVGSHGISRVELAPGEWVEMRTPGPPPPAGQPARIRLRRLHVFDLETGRAIGRVEDGAV